MYWHKKVLAFKQVRKDSIFQVKQEIVLKYLDRGDSSSRQVIKFQRQRQGWMFQVGSCESGNSWAPESEWSSKSYRQKSAGPASGRPVGKETLKVSHEKRTEMICSYLLLNSCDVGGPGLAGVCSQQRGASVRSAFSFLLSSPLVSSYSAILHL